MKPKLRSLGAAIAAMILSASSHAETTTAAQKRIASAQYLVGTWKCAHTVGTFSGTYTTTYAATLGNNWLKQTYEFPASQSGEKIEAAIQAECLMGYDERREAWVRFFANSIGQWFAIRMTETPGGGWTWKYVSFSKNRKPETPEPDATFTKKSDSEYAIDGPSYEENGARVTEHHVCKKL